MSLPRGASRSLYHRWRSTRFSEVVAQEHVTRTLKNAVGSGKTVHAYLFCGPRGTGKTSTARILAKAVNCHTPEDGEPCNRCPSCQAINEGRAIDLIEIDAASNRGIDDARDLRDKIRFSPAEARFKVYIIDEAHMLTSEAANALLKTLEEPPDHAILVLATTEAHKILPTIASRCQRFDFRRIPLQSIVDRLALICREEGIEVGEGVLERISRMSRGSLRDAESLLDQLVAYCGEHIELSSARDVLGLSGEEMVPEFADAVLRRDLASGLTLIDELSKTGADLKHFGRELVDYLRALTVAKSGAETSVVKELRAGELDRLRVASAEWEYGQLAMALRSFGELEGRMRLEPFNQSHLELALLEVVLAQDPALSPARAPSGVPSIEQDSTRLESAGRGSLRAPASVEHPVSRGESPAAPAYVVLRDEETDQGVPPAGDVVPVELTDANVGGPMDLQSVRKRWPQVLREVAGEAGPLGIALQGGEPIEVSGNTVVLGFEKSLWRKKVEQPRVRIMLESSLGKVFGVAVRVEFKFGIRPDRPDSSTDGDAVVNVAIKEMGFQVSRVESGPSE